MAAFLSETSPHPGHGSGALPASKERGAFCAPLDSWIVISLIAFPLKPLQRRFHLRANNAILLGSKRALKIRNRRDISQFSQRTADCFPDWGLLCLQRRDQRLKYSLGLLVREVMKLGQQRRCVHPGTDIGSVEHLDHRGQTSWGTLC